MRGDGRGTGDWRRKVKIRKRICSWKGKVVCVRAVNAYVGGVEVYFHSSVT